VPVVAGVGDEGWDAVAVTLPGELAAGSEAAGPEGPRIISTITDQRGRAKKKTALASSRKMTENAAILSQRRRRVSPTTSM
jgi:hypothetical protein